MDPLLAGETHSELNCPNSTYTSLIIFKSVSHPNESECLKLTKIFLAHNLLEPAAGLPKKITWQPVDACVFCICQHGS